MKSKLKKASLGKIIGAGFKAAKSAYTEQKAVKLAAKAKAARTAKAAATRAANKAKKAEEIAAAAKSTKPAKSVSTSTKPVTKPVTKPKQVTSSKKTVDKKQAVTDGKNKSFGVKPFLIGAAAATAVSQLGSKSVKDADKAASEKIRKMNAEKVKLNALKLKPQKK